MIGIDDGGEGKEKVRNSDGRSLQIGGAVHWCSDRYGFGRAGRLDGEKLTCLTSCNAYLC